VAGGLGGGGKIKVPHPKKLTASTILYASQKILANFELFFKRSGVPPLCGEKGEEASCERECGVCYVRLWSPPLVQEMYHLHDTS